MTLCGDGAVRLWTSTGQGKPLKIAEDNDPILAAQAGPGGDWLLTASERGRIGVWRSDTGERLTYRDVGEIDGATFSPDGTRVLVHSKREVRLFNTDGSGPPLELEQHEWLNISEFSPDGAKLLTVGGQGRRAALHSLEGMGTTSISDSRSRIAIASWGNTARVVSVEDPNDRVLLEAHSGPVVMATFSRDETKVVTASWDRTARVWSATGGGTSIELRGHAAPLTSAGFDREGHRVLTTSWDGTARVWDVDGTQTAVLGGHQGVVWAADFSQDATLVATASADGTVRVWNVDGSGTPTVLRGHQDEVRAVSFSADDSRVVSASWDGTIRIWNADGSGQPIEAERVDEPVGRQEQVWFGGDGEVTSVGSNGDTIRWEWRNGKLFPFPFAARKWRLREYELAGSRVVAPLYLQKFSSRYLSLSEDGEARTLLWRARFCHDPETREELLGESEDEAKANYERCRELTDVCATQPYDVCHARMEAEFTPPEDPSADTTP